MSTTSILKSYAIAAALSLAPLCIYAQNAPKPNWQNLDLKTDTAFGISTEKAYIELLKGKKATPVIVAVIDGGVDIDHEDLKTVIWTNPKEKPGNGKDDDKNGFIDDVHGWNFIGSAKGNIEYENLEATRIVRKFQPKFKDVTSETSVSAADLADYKTYVIAKADYDKQLAPAQANLKGIKAFSDALDEIMKTKPADKSVVD